MDQIKQNENIIIKQPLIDIIVISCIIGLGLGYIARNLHFLYRLLITIFIILISILFQSESAQLKK